MAKIVGNIGVNLDIFRLPAFFFQKRTNRVGHFKDWANAFRRRALLVVIDADTVSYKGTYLFEELGFMRQASLLAGVIDVLNRFLCPLG